MTKAAEAKVEQAVEVLRELGLPRAQQNERSALTLLALAGVKPDDAWKDAAPRLLRTVDVMAFMRSEYGKDYKPNSRETIRRQTLHQFEQARVADRNPDDPTRPTNSGKTCYGLSDAALAVLITFGTAAFPAARDGFLGKLGSLREAYRRTRVSAEVPLTLSDGTVLRLSPGDHNELQAAVIETMGPRFSPGAQVLYVGDTASKHVVYDRDALDAVGVPIGLHDKLPDVVLHDTEAGWLLLVEAVTSHGPISEKRHAELEAMLADCPLGRVYVTAFLTRADFRQYAADVAWETEVWIAENPGHMVHFNGPKFLGPYNPASE